MALIFVPAEATDLMEKEVPDSLSPDIPETRRMNPTWLADGWPLGWLFEIMEELQIGSKATYIIVGATEVRFVYVGLKHDIVDVQHKKETLKQNMLAYVEKEHGHKTLLECKEHFERRIIFYTRDEYRRKVGEKQWRIETVRTKP